MNGRGAKSIVKHLEFFHYVKRKTLKIISKCLSYKLYLRVKFNSILNYVTRNFKLLILKSFDLLVYSFPLNKILHIIKAVKKYQDQPTLESRQQ